MASDRARESRRDVVSGEQKQAGWLGRVAQVLFRMRRRIATGAVIAAALVFGYHAIFGENGLNVYQQRRSEDKSVQKRIDELQKENVHLRQQVQALKTDPDAIEREARSRLHYARPGEVIWTEDAPPSSPNPAQPAKK
ncbi:MAG: septum formation initiator family protein [Acidobacteriaceae bacterium]